LKKKIELVRSNPLNYLMIFKNDPLYECNFDIDSCDAVYTTSVGNSVKYDFRLKSTEIVTGENYYITDYSSICK